MILSLFFTSFSEILSISGLKIAEKFLQYTNSNPYCGFLFKETEKMYNIIFSMKNTTSIKKYTEINLKKLFPQDKFAIDF